MAPSNQRKINFATKVLAVFSEAQKTNSIPKTLIYQLVKYSQEDFELFQYSLEQAYLKIFESFKIKSNKKIPNKFETLAESFFEVILPKNNNSSQNLDSQENQHWKEIFNGFLDLCIEGVYSTIMNIRIMCSRILFMQIKLIPPKQIEKYLEETTQSNLMNSILHLLRTKVSTYRQLGIKLSSLIIHLRSDKINAIERQLFKIMAVEENQQIRKLVITNLTITKENLDDILIRLRDKNPQIRIIVAKKLQGERFRLRNMSITHLYKLLYDGYGSKQILVKKECLRYFSMYFLENQSEIEAMDVENRYRQFIEIFRPDILLLNPHLYYLFDQLIGDLLQEIQAHMAEYIRNACQEIKNNSFTYEIIWLKNAANSQSREIVKIYEEFGPSGLDLSNILKSLNARNQIFAIYELLQLFMRQNMPDEIGRNKMFDALKLLLLQIKEERVRPNYIGLEDNDICHKLDEEEIVRKKLMISYYDMPIISSSFDMIHQIGQTMKKLRPDHYEIEMKEVMAEWNNPDDNVLIKQKQLVEMNMEKLNSSGDKKMYEKMRMKYNEIVHQLEQQAEKTRKILMCISRLRHNCNLESFMSIIKEQLNKEDKANGLLLLGLYCLENSSKVNSFWHVFWGYIQQKQPIGVKKNHLLVSLKVIIDFIVKFNCLIGPFEFQNLDDFSGDQFLYQMLYLLLHEDSDIRILAIESLCRLLYHERIDKDNESIYFLYLFLLWLETSTESVSAKAVHTVSIFIKSYLQKGNRYSLKFAEIACLFLKVLVKFNEQEKCINKEMIKYNLTMEEFFKKVTFMFMTICKYHKENRSIIWTYNPQETEMGPQQFLLLYMLEEESLVPLIGKALIQCDFYEQCGLQTLIMVKKKLQLLTQTRKWKGTIESTLKKIESEIQLNISSKNAEIFNEQAVQALQSEYSEKMKLLNQESKYIHRNIEDRGLFVKVNDESDDESERISYGAEDDESEEAEQSEKEEKSVVSRKRMLRNLSESDQSSQKQNSKDEQKPKPKKVLNRQLQVCRRVRNLRTKK